MGCFIKFKLEVPKDNYENYKKFILKRIYGLDEDDLWFSNNKEKLESPFSVDLLEETNDHYIIAFYRSTFTMITNVLPETSITSNELCSDSSNLKEVKYRILSEIQSAHDQLGEFFDDYNISIEELPNIIKDLTITHVIDKYFQFNEPDFICSASKIPLHIYLNSKGLLKVKIVYNVIFDVDDGFSAPNNFGPSSCKHDLIHKLNDYYKQWKYNGDITSPVLPVNIII